MLNQIAQLLGISYFGETPATARNIEEAIQSLREDISRWRGRAEKVEGEVLSAHSMVFGPPRNYVYTDTETTIDLLVADLLATQAERDALAAQFARQLDRLRQIEALTCPAGSDYGNSEVCTIARAGLAETAPEALDAIKRVAAAEAIENEADKWRHRTLDAWDWINAERPWHCDKRKECVKCDLLNAAAELRAAGPNSSNSSNSSEG